MSNRKKPRGQRINKPELPQKYEVDHVVGWFEDQLSDTLKRGLIKSEPEWTYDGYWEMDIMPMGKGKTSITYTIIWDKKNRKWVLKAPVNF